eukprot:Nk52_evm19s2596 gene=Nk52_evmTU19s2596
MSNFAKAKDFEATVPTEFLSHENGDVEVLSSSGGAGVAKTIFNIICTMVGVGILSLPYSVAITGWLVGLIFIVVGGIFAGYCGIILARCMNDGVPGKRMGSYEELGEVAGGVFGKYMAIIMSYGTCWSACIIMIILGAAQFESLFGSQVTLTTAEWSIICACIILPFTFIKYMTHVAYVSFFGMFASVLVFLVAICQDINDMTKDGMGSGLVAANTSSTFSDMAQAYVTISFAFGGACVFGELLVAMKKPGKFSSALTLAFISMFVIYAGIGIVSYMAYGSKVLDPQYNGSLTALMPNNWISKIVFASVLVHVLSAFVVLFNPLVRAIERKVGIDDQPHLRELFFRVIIRSINVAICCFVAIALPFFGDIMGLVGGTAVCGSSFLLPLWFYVSLFYRRKCIEPVCPKERRNGYLEMAACGVIFIVSLFAGVVGTYNSIKVLIDKSSTYHLF